MLGTPKRVDVADRLPGMYITVQPSCPCPGTDETNEKQAMARSGHFTMIPQSYTSPFTATKVAISIPTGPSVA